jgi:hypothetical protein
MIIGFDSGEWWEKAAASQSEIIPYGDSCSSDIFKAMSGKPFKGCQDRGIVVNVGDNCWYISGYGMSDEEIKLLTDRCSGRAQTEKQK